MTSREALIETLASGGSLDVVEAGDAADALLGSDWLNGIRAQVWREARDEAARFVTEPYNTAAVLMAIFSTKASAGEGI